MKKYCKAFLTALFLAAIAAAASAGDKKTVDTYPFAQGGLLELDLEIGGNVTVTGWERDEAEITLTRRGSDPGQLEVIAGPTDSGVRITARSAVKRLPKNTTLDVSVRLPGKSSHKISTLGGNVEMSGIAGRVTGKTMGGNVVMKSMNGSVDFVTMGGSITLEDSVLDGSVKTMGGGLRFVSVDGALEGSTMGGQIEYDGMARGGSADKTASVGGVSLQTMGGGITVKNIFRDLDAETMGGNIRIDRARGKLDLSSMGGSITVGDADSSLSAVTMGGNIVAGMTANESGEKTGIRLESSGGKINLDVPVGYPMSVDIALEITRKAIGNFQIKSGIPLERTEEKGTPADGLKKTLYARGATGSGVNGVIIRTTNGSVTLEEK